MHICGTGFKKLRTLARYLLRYLRRSWLLTFIKGSLAKKSSSLSVPLSHLKFTSITSLSFSSARSKDWEDVLTAHASSGAGHSISGEAASSYARTWSVQNKRLGRWTMGLSTPGVDSRGPLPKLGSGKQLDDPASVLTTKSRKKMHTSPGGGVARSVFVTACGNFGLAGSSTGHIVMWNMQSGIRRKNFDVGSSKYESSHNSNGNETNAKSSKTKGSGRAITGVAVDSLNKVLVATTLDGTVNVRAFQKFGNELDISNTAPVLRLPYYSTRTRFTFAFSSKFPATAT
jgi:U3 small nucleolar RNA-associated protein 21